MQFDEADTTPLKTWLIAQLEDISDADSDVLGDYVLALVKSEEPEDEVRVNCLGALEDFLGDHTQKFVDDVFNAIHSKSYLPGYVAPRPAQAVVPTIPPPTGPTAPSLPSGQAPSASFSNGGRKRGYNDQQGAEPEERRDPHYGDRAQKQMRRGNQRGGLYNGRDGRGYDQSHPGGFPNVGQFPDMATMNSLPPSFSPPPGFPQLDPNNPMAAIMAMQAMGFPPLPGFPAFPGAGSPLDQNMGERRLSGSLAPRKTGERCRDYDTKGFCAVGSMCAYEHGSDHIIVPGASDEYDPRQASLPTSFNSSPTDTQVPKPRQFDNSRPSRGGRGGRGGQNGGMTQNPRGRATFSSAAPNNDRNVTTIVVEQIPEEHFSEEAVRAFFAEFGTIDEVTMQAYKRLALIKYTDYAAARRAYDSPKVIFDNRFVKVYWYKPDSLPTPRHDAAGSNGSGKVEPEDEPMVDPEAFALKQAEAQRVHEEKAKKLKEAEAQREELDRRIKAQAEDRRRLLEKLAKKTGTAPPAPGTAQTNGNSNGTTTATAKKPASAQTEALRAKLAELEAEAETLGLSPHDDPSAAPSSYRGRGGSRGGYQPRGRGGFAPRGRGRGGAGAWAGFAGNTGAVARLDNRPKSVSVLAADSNIDFDDGGAAESLRGFLFGVGDFGAISTAATESGTSEEESKRKNRATVRFNERYVAEEFIRRAGGGEGIPGIGKVELGWVANAPLAMPVATAAVAGKAEQEDVEMGERDKGGREDREMDYDVADDDDDRWAR